MKIEKGKFYKVLQEDEELLQQFPEFTLGTKFQVLQMKKEPTGINYKGITKVKFNDGKEVSIKDNEDTWFWCFFLQTSAVEKDLKEITPEDFYQIECVEEEEGNLTLSELFHKLQSLLEKHPELGGQKITAQSGVDESGFEWSEIQFVDNDYEIAIDLLKRK